MKWNSDSTTLFYLLHLLPTLPYLTLPYLTLPYLTLPCFALTCHTQPSPPPILTHILHLLLNFTSTTEYMGMVYGQYDAKEGTKGGHSFVPGGSSLHSCMYVQYSRLLYYRCVHQNIPHLCQSVELRYDVWLGVDIMRSVVHVRSLQ